MVKQKPQFILFRALTLKSFLQFSGLCEPSWGVDYRVNITK